MLIATTHIMIKYMQPIAEKQNIFVPVVFGITVSIICYTIKELQLVSIYFALCSVKQNIKPHLPPYFLQILSHTFRLYLIWRYAPTFRHDLPLITISWITLPTLEGFSCFQAWSTPSHDFSTPITHWRCLVDRKPDDITDTSVAPMT